MPVIKFPKGFSRRKSSGNALEELTNPPEPSFRVFERPGSQSFDGGSTLKQMSQGRPRSAGPQLEENIFADSRIGSNQKKRSSGVTNNSASTGGQNDNSSASGRFSSSSTLPSSTDAPADEKPLPNPMDSRKIPVPPIPEPQPLTLRAGGRSFSFGRRKAQSPSTPASAPRFTTSPQNAPLGYSHATRERAMTESSYTSGSTATPPKLPDTDLGLGQSDLDGFGSMFESFGKRRSQAGLAQEGSGLATTGSPEPLSPAGPKVPAKSYFGDRPSYSPSPIQVGTPGQAESSPYSWGSHDSEDGLIHSDSPTAAETTSNGVRAPPVPQHGSGLIASKIVTSPSSSSPSVRPRLQRPQSGTGAGLRRSSAYVSNRDSYSWQDEDARVVMDSINASRKLNRRSGAFGSYGNDMNDVPPSTMAESSAYPPSSTINMNPLQNTGTQHRQFPSATLFDSNDQDFQTSSRRLESSETTPRAKQRGLVQQEERSLFDASPPTSARFDAPLQYTNPNITKPNGNAKVMTPAQFERYRKEQEITRTRSNASKSDGSDDENETYDDDDETERNRQLARQRRKQEAHLAVYRQQMMKMTGEQPSDLPNIGQLRPGMDRAIMSTPDLSGRTSTLNFNLDKAPGKSSDDEDEDVPLGILAAHGFPTKNRPPSALGNAGANPYIRYTSESYPAPPMSTAGTSAAGGGKGLPPFARNLPQDPYYGAGLVNPSNRESLAFGANGGASTHGGYAPNLPPGGLVGVIAGEERARAMRRGSPNAQGNYGSPLPQGMPQMPTVMPPGMLPMPMMSPGEEAQVQMSQQMTQMMHMQMQWMQQMQQMVAGGMQGPQPGLPQQHQQQQQLPINNGFLSPPGQVSRPTSMGSHSAPGSPALMQQGQQRAMSMMGPSTGLPWSAQGNVRMTAPSMMSGALGNQGYAPSIAPSERSNIGMPSRYRPVSIALNDEVVRSSSRASMFTSEAVQSGDERRSGLLTTIRPVPSSKTKGGTVSDDDDEEGWEQMKQKREKRKSTWRSKKKDGHDVQDIYFPEA